MILDNRKCVAANFWLNLLTIIVLTLFFSSLSYSQVTKNVALISNNTDQRQPYLMGVFPYLAPRELEKMYAPIAADYANTLGQNVQFMTSSTYKSFMKNLDNELYDIVFVQPFDYVAIADKYGYLPIATRNKPLPAILVVNPNSSIKTIADLKGKTIALPPSVAAMSYLIKDYLMENGLNPETDVTIMHYRSHGSCMQKVLIKIADACGTAPPALRFFQAKMKTTLQIIAKTKSIPSSIFAIHPRVAKEHRQKLIKQITSWNKTSKGKQLLKGAKVEFFIPISDNAYNDVRSMAKKYR
ncbi:MAG: phosphate/phosphite/phosphonate ABC transporter substrate-binding protein [Thiohalomonadales bacterium]